MKKLIPIIFFILAGTSVMVAQKVHPITVHAIVDGVDTIPVISLTEVEIYSFKIPATRKAQKQLTKLIRNVKKVYPWARLGGIMLRKYGDLLVAAENENDRRKIMKQAEKEINERYSDELQKLTFAQGKILIKLIDRETGNSSFNLLQELRGKFTAFFYQAFARIWGYNLKVKYDPEGEDKQIETIVRMIERGQI
ncbi:MAG: DUF4294 domain-containing protein [Bacteroidetes bacterium]|nr:DUF4294 domain-containing protein [Bacteroidota bacterium]MBL6944487.1 DUF4294 domain-containing protein [Bacteroidales bacterium]